LLNYTVKLLVLSTWHSETLHQANAWTRYANWLSRIDVPYEHQGQLWAGCTWIKSFGACGISQRAASRCRKDDSLFRYKNWYSIWPTRLWVSENKYEALFQLRVYYILPVQILFYVCITRNLDFDWGHPVVLSNTITNKILLCFTVHFDS
jgi:hypothetical protein